MQQQRVPDVDINVTPRVLNFPKNGRTSLVLKATVSGRDEAYPWSFSLESQLPECFTIVENPSESRNFMLWVGVSVHLHIRPVACLLVRVFTYSTGQTYIIFCHFQLKMLNLEDVPWQN